MAHDYATTLYSSKAWHKLRKSYLSVHPLCERCLKRGDIVPAKIIHHREYVTPLNINDVYVTLNWDNLESLCQDCHNIEHHGEHIKLDYAFDSTGQIVPLPP